MICVQQLCVDVCILHEKKEKRKKSWGGNLENQLVLLSLQGCGEKITFDRSVSSNSVMMYASYIKKRNKEKNQGRKFLDNQLVLSLLRGCGE